MNKNTTAVILIVLAIGIYFTFTRAQVSELKVIKAQNDEYQKAIDNSVKLVSKRDTVEEQWRQVSPEDQDNLDKLVPDNVDNVRLIIDVKDDIAAKYGLFLKNIKTTSPEVQNQAAQTPGGVQQAPAGQPDKYGVVTLSFTVTASYEAFLNFLKDLEGSLRIMDVSRLAVSSNDQGTYDFTVDLKTYWLKQK
jgi:Tfp pilus assembly protein PilO